MMQSRRFPAVEPLEHRRLTCCERSDDEQRGGGERNRRYLGRRSPTAARQHRAADGGRDGPSRARSRYRGNRAPRASVRHAPIPAGRRLRPGPGRRVVGRHPCQGARPGSPVAGGIRRADGICRADRRSDRRRGLQRAASRCPCGCHARRAVHHRDLLPPAARPARRTAARPRQADRRRPGICRSSGRRHRASHRRTAGPGRGGSPRLAAGSGERSPGGSTPLPGRGRARPRQHAIHSQPMLVGWRGPVAAVAAGCAIFLPLGMMAGELRGLGPYGGRVLVHVLSIAGFSLGVALLSLVIGFRIGTPPHDSADRGVLGLSMLAAAVAAIGYLPARDRLVTSATRFVYGAREAPDEALRTFGSRLTRAIPMDELLLQLAESLRKTMGLTRAEVYTGMGDVLERAVSVPDAGPRSIVVTQRERPVVTRAGVSGSAWVSVWLPALLEGREDAQLRMSPVSHGGELLGLIVVERPAAADSFSEDDDRVLTELARQVGLAFHNAQLDATLQTTLDELRGQAEALRESRARIVATGDAERRRVERNLHDGAQQNLVALAVNLRLARDIVADDPDAAAEMLGEIADQVKLTIQELRELAHGI